ncbi:hypothetical protein JD844_001755 [Phrynosoma platyrhinos]|uniref:Uncharacterized protein n=1 Tax=Phrynosoma platyrhinos TaxID=52577 RepID=A0ABQ7TB48_PHRPL|nr:hypothetical protein JD844_001755 [Phrynosoma platyrhinos]
MSLECTPRLRKKWDEMDTFLWGITAAFGETGLLVSKITETRPFEGYAGDHQKSEKKILRDVLKKGDCYFNSGDLLMQDQHGFLYFQDRVGDTFRWKGENVATTEVERTLAMLDFIQEVNVYGVPVPGGSEAHI